MSKESKDQKSKDTNSYTGSSETHVDAASDYKMTSGQESDSVSLIDELKDMLREVDTKMQACEKREAQLAIREQQVREAEMRADEGFAAKRSNLEDELFRRKREFDADLAAKRSEALESIEKEAQEARNKKLKALEDEAETERARLRNKIDNERAALENQKTLLEEQREELEQLKGKLAAQRDEVERRNSEFQDRERELEDQEARIRERAKKRAEQLDEEVKLLTAEYKAGLESEKEAMANENNRLRSSLRTQEDLLAAYRELEARLGGENPETVLLELNSKTEEIRKLREELATRPTEELRDRYAEMERTIRSKDMQIEELTRKVAAGSTAATEMADLKRRIAEVEAERKASETKAQIFETSAKQAAAELEKMQADFDRLYGTPAGEEERREEIEMPYISRADARPPETEPDINEIEWLDGIHNACEDYGLHFNRRLLTAFHTSLKTAEWAPLTVLAGVSGTGKSELPRLYSHFGGLYFAPVPVQPNWDSQESMLGFFNSIDNRFDAQPILNFLAQTQKEWDEAPDGYPGLRGAMSLVLLDEMNLAHPELYFADFLSKLELRRGTRTTIPDLDVKIGSGMRPYKLPLNRNVLWVGTMNQDETTKSLSDKVLDRSIVMHFPRPTELKRRKSLKPLNEDNRGAILSNKTWSTWCQMRSIFEDDEILPYKEFIEEMNSSLGVAGRAIGHRVWQSVEYYMSNYPDVLAAEDRTARHEAMHFAFEDQLVQKVMPKLRGIDTRGKTKTECLDKIREQLVTGIDGEGFDLTEDFDQSCELGYGQFIWQSANYLKEDSLDDREIVEQEA